MPDENGKLTICIDFDGVINNYAGWKGVGVFADPVPGTKEALQLLKMEGHTIIIHTTRGESWDIMKYLDNHDIPYDHVNRNPNQHEYMSHGKPMADVYIDDRAMRFEGCWPATVHQILTNHLPWGKRI